MTDADILALRERVAKKLKIPGTLPGRTKYVPPRLDELCKPMLEWLQKFPDWIVMDLDEGRVWVSAGRKTLAKLDDSPALALAMAVDALGEVKT